jgi:hypothetical protein
VGREDLAERGSEAWRSGPAEPEEDAREGKAGRTSGASTRGEGNKGDGTTEGTTGEGTTDGGTESGGAVAGEASSSKSFSWTVWPGARVLNISATLLTSSGATVCQSEVAKSTKRSRAAATMGGTTGSASMLTAAEAAVDRRRTCRGRDEVSTKGGRARSTYHRPSKLLGPVSGGRAVRNAGETPMQRLEGHTRRGIVGPQVVGGGSSGGRRGSGRRLRHEVWGGKRGDGAPSPLYPPTGHEASHEAGA